MIGMPELLEFPAEFLAAAKGCFAHFEKHRAAHSRLTELAEGQRRWGLPVFCIGEFLRIVTHPRLFDRPLGNDEAITLLERLAESPVFSLLLPGDRFLPLLREAIIESGATGNLVFDAQIVALCREAGAQSLLTEDRDYARFRGFPVKRL